MKPWMRLAATALVTLAGTAALAAGSEGSELTAWARFKAYAHQEKEIAVKEGQKLIAATDKRIDEIKQQVKTANHQTAEAHKANMAELEAKKKATQAHLDKMAQSTASAWDATKHGFANAYKDLHDAYDKTKAKN